MKEPVYIVQLIVLGQIQIVQLVVGTVQLFQSGVFGHIQPGQIVVGAVEHLEIGETLQTIQVGQPQAGHIQLGDALPLAEGQDTVGAHAAEIVFVFQPVFQNGIGKGFFNGQFPFHGRESRRICGQGRQGQLPTKRGRCQGACDLFQIGMHWFSPWDDISPALQAKIAPLYGLMASLSMVITEGIPAFVKGGYKNKSRLTAITAMPAMRP